MPQTIYHFLLADGRTLLFLPEEKVTLFGGDYGPVEPRAKNVESGHKIRFKRRWCIITRIRWFTCDFQAFKKRHQRRAGVPP
jgi:hypothetical protein